MSALFVNISAVLAASFVKICVSSITPPLVVVLDSASLDFFAFFFRFVPFVVFLLNAISSLVLMFASFDVACRLFKFVVIIDSARPVKSVSIEVLVTVVVVVLKEFKKRKKSKDVLDVLRSLGSSKMSRKRIPWRIKILIPNSNYNSLF